ncbi:DUF3108 domain-containing protein [Anaeromyxobacter oryzae]|uniref:DUF3108 domain-containing protein n=1 Tax=Anaeromyxobacter oryzae TaxID=2918170 RepID=A0ABM7WQM7_9BACT|nr:DUF3108 domain-containing protein [Anaeromyxobacter oryzae]BDG01765.1 hypothetical protein AMOR_07610 [Anaeromyxobacter oryzae]
MTLAALAALALAAPPCGLPLPAGPLPWSTGETLTYDLDLLGIVKAGTLELSVERPMSGGRIVPLRARARTDASFANLTRIAAVALSWVDPRTLRPERYREEADENGVHKVGDAKLAPPGADVTITYEVAGRRSTATYARQGEALDALSALYRLRAAHLAPGDTFCLDLVARGRYWRVTGTVAPRTEKVQTPLGRLETLRVDASLRRANAPNAPPSAIHLWISRDPARLLVGVVGEVDAGPVRAMLTAARGVRR